MKEPYEYPIDFMIAIDEWGEWDRFRYLIGEELKDLEVRKEIKQEYLPLIAYFEGEIKKKLIKVGFRKEILENQKRFKTVLNGLDNQNVTIDCTYGDVWKYPPFAYGYPADVVDLNDDKSRYWIKPDIEAALRALESITIIKELLVTEGLVNKNAERVFLRSLELVVNLARAGSVPEKARQGVSNSLTQSKKAKLPRSRDGMTPAERNKRDHEMISHFKRTHLTASSFAERYASKYNLKPRRVREILKKALGN